MNEQLKSYKTVEQIAKKHRMNVSDIQKQLDMGAPIEHEHTNNQKLAVEIALQHLDEIPDYYTRLKKMEADAKKHHKKFKDVRIDEEGLRDWFGKSRSKEGKPGWVNAVTGGTCASDEPGEGTPKCVSSAKRESMTKLQRLSATRRKKEADPRQQEKSGAAKPTYVSTDSKKKMKEEMNLQEVKDKPGKGSGKKDACYTKVKSRYDVWPSAYASGALTKCRKVGAANWGTKSESTDSLDYDWDTPVRERADRYCPKCEKLEKRGECKYGPRYWDMFSLPAELISSKKDYNIVMPHPANEEKDHEHSMARSEISTIIGAAKRLKKKIGKGEGNIEAWVQSKITKAADYIDAAADYVDSGEMQKEQISFEVGHTSKDARNALRQDKIRKLASQGSTEGERNAAKGKLSGVQLPLANSYIPKTLGRFMIEAKKSEMKCNSPKSEPVGDSLTGKSHVVKACEGGKEKLIRFGQRGVKGSPKKEGESKAYASRRHRFQTRHAKNIAKGKMSAAYWANKVKW